MQSVPSPANPFALMLDPQAIFDKIEHSERLERLQRRVCRPLDKPLLPLDPGVDAADDEIKSYDRSLDEVEAPTEALIES